MMSYIFSFFNFFSKKNDSEDDDERADFLADQIVELEAADAKEELFNDVAVQPEIPRSAACFQRTGVITYMNDKDYVLIDGMLYFDISSCSIPLQTNDKVLYLGYKDENDSIVVVRILQNQGLFWGDEEEDAEEESFKVIEHVIIGEVDSRQERFVHFKDNDLKFSLDDVEGTFIPIKGDWLEMKCNVQFDENKPADISSSQVLEVSSFKPLRSMIKKVTITTWSGESGICDRQIYLGKQCLPDGIEPKVGSKAMVEAIESTQGTCAWRVIKLIQIEENHGATVKTSELPKQVDEEEQSLSLEKEKKILFTHPIKFENVNFHQNKKIIATVTNNSDRVQTLNKWIMLSKKKDSQIDIKPFLSQPIKLHPNQSFDFTITCTPKFFGNSFEILILLFRGFQLKRFIGVNVVDENLFANGDAKKLKTQREKTENMRNVKRNNYDSIVPGVRPVRPPNFVPVKLGAFPIPEKVWAAVLGDSEQTIFSSEYDKILDRIESILPCLTQDLNINNYIDKWHYLLYMEEIQNNINMRVYDMPKTFLIRCQEYLAVEVNNLSERRPSLIQGDKAIVTDIWDSKSSKYEGFIHTLKGDLVLMKFNPYFHETYSGSDVSLEFHFSRSTFRRAHQAINLALSNLGPEILFPTKIMTKSSQVALDSFKEMSWFNSSLNDGQKEAVINILKGEGRPLPYCIYGPPGTGKTITVIETILQILSRIPHSRILVATPSNSAANLITERLIQYRKSFSDSMIRLIANYLVDSENIPDTVKPFCATLDIAREGTSQSKQTVKDGVNLNCQTSFIGRHRVTIGTCYCIGTLAQMGLPRGHFTHVIVDEAGQATEPEILIPLTFIEKENAQIILAGDPKQLGPTIMSKYCTEYGMDESYMSRILETFPYQKDYDAFATGYNNKVVTKLNDNYRSLGEVLTLPSEMFYDSSLVPNLEKSLPWIQKTLNVLSDVFETNDPTTGGIFVYGIRGCNMRAEDSPSWYNPQEASMLALTTCKLYKRNISLDDIGIITPYIAQIKYLRTLFDAMGLPQPKIGTVEEFQGQERPIILISTVRSSESLLEVDHKHTLGFVKNPKRLNVALTRAQIAVILFCNPHLLSTDLLWNKVIAQSVKQDKYMGCDLPNCYVGLSRSDNVIERIEE